MNATTSCGLVYNTASVRIVLHLAVECGDSVPESNEGEVVIYYGGWDLNQLRTCMAGERRMSQKQDWSDRYIRKAEPGYYRLLLPVPGSHNKNWEDQLQQLAVSDPAWKPAPLAVVATALLVHLTLTGNDRLADDWCRCAEVLPGGGHAALAVLAGQVCMDYAADDVPSASMWLSAARKC